MQKTLEVLGLFITKEEPPSEAGDIKNWINDCWKNNSHNSEAVITWVSAVHRAKIQSATRFSLSQSFTRS